MTSEYAEMLFRLFAALAAGALIELERSPRGSTPISSFASAARRYCPSANCANSWPRTDSM